MQLDEAQKQTVAKWIADGLKLSDIQKRIDSELGRSLTYMEVRLLVDDLRLTPKDVEQAKPTELIRPAAGTSAAGTSASPAKPVGPTPAATKKEGQVSVTVDDITRPGAMVSGKVTFTDGNTAEWFLDQSGRLGLAPLQQGYRPSAQDVQTFQLELQNELTRLGF
jgi:hypothetical protein